MKSEKSFSITKIVILNWYDKPLEGICYVDEFDKYYYFKLIANFETDIDHELLYKLVQLKKEESENLIRDIEKCSRVHNGTIFPEIKATAERIQKFREKNITPLNDDENIQDTIYILTEEMKYFSEYWIGTDV